MPRFTDPDDNVFGLLKRGSGDQPLIGPFGARREIEHRLSDDV